ncbi:MAG: DUF1361 domain-containing protein [Armatimonadota bacterium]
MDRSPSIVFIWVSWNTFLAIIPIVFAYLIDITYRSITKSRIKTVSLVTLGILWMLFLPNTCYLLTEWRHFLIEIGERNLHVQWQESSRSALSLMIRTLFYLCYSGIGVLTFAAAIRPIVRILKQTEIKLWLIGIPFFILLSLGVYLGLILRFNSWDLFSRPNEIWWSITRLLYRPTLSGLILLFGGFLWLSYIIMDIWIDGFICRWKETSLKKANKAI